jgi:hypothetical protein
VVTAVGYTGTLEEALEEAIIDKTVAAESFVPVTEITNVPDTAYKDVETYLTGAIVNPETATNRTIVWTVKTGTGVTDDDLADGSFTPTVAGDMVLTATIAGGLTEDTPFTDDFTITVSAEDNRQQLEGTVSISGNAERGATLAAADPAATLTNETGTPVYHWQRNDSDNSWTDAANIAEANTLSYTLAEADVGKYIRFTVSYSGNSGVVESNVLGPVVYPDLTGQVSITGTARVGGTLTADTAGLSGQGNITTYQWKRGDTADGDFTDISGNGATYTATAEDDLGKFISVEVSRAGYIGTKSATTVAAVVPNSWTVTQSGGTAGAATSTSTGIAFTFDEAADGLSADDITVVTMTGSVTKGAISGSGKNRTLALDAVAANGEVWVIINRAGIEKGPRKVAVHKGPIGWTATANGTAGTANSTAITLDFNEEVSGLTADDITVTGSATKGQIVGAMTSDLKRWMLVLTEVAAAGNVSVSITKEGIASGPQSVTVHKKTNGSNSNAVALDGLEAYLETLPPGTAERPNVVVLGAINISDNWGAINTAVAGKSKYVVLDLTNCTATGNKISGKSKPTGNNFNIISTNQYVKGIILPSTLTATGNYSFKDCAYLTAVTIPEGVTNASGLQTFSNSGVLSVTIPSSVKTISSDSMNAFGSSKSLVSVTFLSIDTLDMGSKAFKDCAALKSVTVSPKVTVGDSNDYAFQNCAALSSVTIMEDATAIGAAMFENCASLTSITIPSGVTDVQTGAFRDTSLSVIVLANSPPTIYKDMKEGYSLGNPVGIYVPANSLAAYKTAWSYYADKIEAIPE